MLQTHWLRTALPTAVVNVFAGHVVHACEPSQSLYVPRAHCEHGPPSGPVNPGTHAQMVLPTTDDWFCVQVVHAWTPVSALNLPTAHATHACAYTTSYVMAVFSTCVYPTLHTQLVTLTAAAGEFLMAAQSVHATGPVTFLYLPATQATHTSPVFPVYPGPHAHSALPLCDTLFAWQLRHGDVPAMRLYVPAGHAWQLLGPPVKPALHWHAPLPATDVVLPVHARHTPPA